MRTRAITLLVASLFLTACGGGGGSSSEPPSSTVPPPSGSTPDSQPEADTVWFVDVTASLGLDYAVTGNQVMNFDAAGISLFDIEDDDSLELYIAHGGLAPGRLFTMRNGVFEAVENNRGITPSGPDRAGYFLDMDGDGLMDFVSIESGGVAVYRGSESGQFVEATDQSDIIDDSDSTYSLAAADFDQDGDLDLFLSPDAKDPQPLTQYLWRNQGQGVFDNVSSILPIHPETRAYTPTFADINSDGFPDLLLVGDFETSQVLLNIGGNRFEDITDDTISDENGMGGTVADYDGDGDLDWFVSSILGVTDKGVPDQEEQEDQELTGNRLYQNDGTGRFQDVTEAAGVRNGSWGWGSCFADFNNDGHPDLFHTNGASAPFDDDRSRLFIADGSGSFSERAEALGVTHTGQGRGVVCADYDRDGRIDVFIANHAASPTVYRNEYPGDGNYLQIDLKGVPGNATAAGARVVLTSASSIQTQEVQLGTWYLSQGPGILHFGLGEDVTVTAIDVHWPGPGGSVSRLEEIAANQRIEILQPRGSGLQVTVVNGDGTGLYEAGESVTLTAAEAVSGYHFSHWTSSTGLSLADPQSATTTFTMPEALVSVTANYLPGVPLELDVSVARRWNEVLLQAIRNDYARPTVHARNLFHISAAMYDAWAFYDELANPWLLGSERVETACPIEPDLIPSEDHSADEAISFAAYRLIQHRFEDSPGTTQIMTDADSLMSALGYDAELDSSDYTRSSAALGNYIAGCYMELGLVDGANEQNDYANVSYQPVNPPLAPSEAGNPAIVDLNRWQPLSLVEFIDQAGNPVDSVPEFLSPEWGSVLPFALSTEDLTTNSRNGYDYLLFHDPGAPPTVVDGLYKWGFSLVAVWSAQLSPDDGVMIDISPASIGNIESLPSRFEDYRDFYDLMEGGDASRGYSLNPVTGEPYAPQWVPRGDYVRVLAEFWADGPDSETPPGHWFVLMNEVNDHPMFVRRFEGAGQELPVLEWDVKSYFVLGGAMHDAAISAWGAKGWYDYIRPISAIRAMTDRGQSTNPESPSYHEDGIPLVDGAIELISEGDELAGDEQEHVGKIKLLAWRGPDYVADPDHDVAGVGWIRAEDWWPYQRPSFVTPPFAGYVSGHSTYSRAAAEVLTELTGDPYFPGGMSGFSIEANEFLVFEDGPSVDMTLQWATYRDASDQCSLSRIWGGIHPPLDDIPGRLMGIEIGRDAFRLAKSHFDGTVQQ